MPVDIASSSAVAAPMAAAAATAPRPIVSAVLRGLRRRCPSCGIGACLHGYLKVCDHCARCGEPLGHIRADDFPPYITIFLVGHLIVPLVLWVEQHYAPPMAAQIVAWPLLTLALTLLILPHAKGAVLGLMWALRLRGDEQH